VLDDLHQMMKPGRVLVLTALGAPTPADIQRRGFQTMARPITVGDIVEKATALVRRR
jgi:hypothetical protein